MSNRSRSFGYECLEARHFLAANPIISEFMASNKGVVVDGYGAASDWIELFNAGDENINLQGFRLTDDAENLSKWTFPSAVLAPGQYLVVFASNRGGVDPAGYLHTNFALSASGEYLALVNPQGQVVSAFGSSQQDYPPQGDNASFGVAFDSTTQDAITAQSATKYLIPSNGSVDSSWMLPQFNDAAWAAGTARLGYEVSPGAYASLIQTQLPVGTKSVYIRIPFNVGDVDSVLGVLRMKYDDGFVAYLNGVEIVRSNAPAALGYDASATSFRPQEAAVLEQAFNVSSHSGLLQLGQNVLAIHLLDSDDGPIEDLLVAPSLTLSNGAPILPLNAGGMIVPTPGGPNSNVLASDVGFSRGGGVISGPISVALTSNGVGEVIRYTTDGSVPNESSAIYLGPISISVSTQLRARAFGLAGQVGRVRSEAFTRADAGVAGFNSDLPIVVLENFGGGVPHREFEDATLSLYDVDSQSGRSALSDQPALTSQIGHHRRGYSTFNQPKPNLRIEFRDENGQDVNVSLLGMPSESDWILYAPHTTDHSLLRNVVMYDLSGQVVEYAVRTRFVEVFYNSDGGALDANDYIGVYVLMENIKRDDNRVAIDELGPGDLNAPDITGGYILKVDRGDGEEDASWDALATTGTSEIVHVEPERAEMTQTQVDYIRGYIDDFETALYGPNWRDPEIGYAAYIDVDGWIDHHLLRVLSREHDALSFSEHLVKPRGGKLNYGPAWDFDRSSGSEGSHYLSAEGWDAGAQQYKVFQYAWWNRLFSDPDFKQKWIDRWQELRETVYSDANLIATIGRHSETIVEAFPRNHARWPETAPNGGGYADPGSVGLESEVSHLRNWLLTRAAWIDGQMIAQPVIELAPSNVPNEIDVTFTHGAGVLYYTLDGSDPRTVGGGVSPSAILYVDAFKVAPGVQVTARVFDVAGAVFPLTAWSGAASETTDATDHANALRIVELMYNPPGSADDTEYFELMNTGSAVIQLAGFRIAEFSSGGFTFSGGSLNPGERIVVVKNQAAFAAAYPNVTNIAAGEFSGSLANEGELVVLLNPLGETVQAFNYGDSNIVGWPDSPDGDGWSLEYVGPLNGGENPLDVLPADPFDNPANWRASLLPAGSPGTDGEPNAPDSGDFNDDGLVDGDDFLAWQLGVGTSNPQKEHGDANNDRVVDEEDLNVWKSQYGGAPPQAVTAALGTRQTVATGALPAPLAAVVTAAVAVPAAEEKPVCKQLGNYWIETLVLASPFQRPMAPSTAVESPIAESTDGAFAGYEESSSTPQVLALDLLAVELLADEESAGEEDFTRFDEGQMAGLLAGVGD